MNTPHKWANEIKAWADGKRIDCSFAGGDWEPCEFPAWHDFKLNFRIAPEVELPEFPTLETQITPNDHKNLTKYAIAAVAYGRALERFAK